MDGITLFVVVACSVGIALGGAVQLAAFIHKKALEEEQREKAENDLRVSSHRKPSNAH